jgi:uncharacterized membrane protein YccC
VARPIRALRTGVARAGKRFEPLAPEWLVQVVTPKRAPVPWANMVRFALSITAPLLAGEVLGLGAVGGFAGMGALVGAFGDAGGPFRRRFRRAALGVAAGLIGLLVGRLVLVGGWLGVPVVGVFGVLSGLISAISAEFSFAGLQLLVYLAIASGPARVAPVPALVMLFVAGAGWSVLLSFLQTRLLPQPDRPPSAVAAVLDELIGLLRVIGGTDAEEVRQARHRLTAAVGTAYDAITDARAHSPGGRTDLRRLSGVLAAVIQLAAVALDAAATRPEAAPAAIPAIEALRDGIARGERHRPAPVPAPAEGPVASAVAHATEQLDRTGGDGGSAPPGRVRVRPATVLAELLAGRTTWVQALRLGITLMAAEAVTLLLPISHPYWVLLTTAVVLKPDFGSVFARGVQRILGTVVGVLIGAAVLALVPTRLLLLIPAAVFAFLFPFGATRNFGMLSTFLTPLVLILVDFGGAGAAGIALSRLLDTAVGAGVVLLVGYLPWPSTWRPDLRSGIADGVDALAAYARVAVTHRPREVTPARRKSYGTLADIRSDLQGALAEPTPRARAASAWFPLISQLERVADDLRDASILESRLRGAPPAGEVAALADALNELAAAIRDGRSPRDLPLPDSGVLAPAARDLATARRIVTGEQDS